MAPTHGSSPNEIKFGDNLLLTRENEDGQGGSATLHPSRYTECISNFSPDPEPFDMDVHDTKPEIAEKAFDNCQSYRSSHLKVREVLKKKVADGDVGFWDTIPTFHHGLAEYLLSGSDYEPSFLLEYEVAFLEILDVLGVDETDQTNEWSLFMSPSLKRLPYSEKYVMDRFDTEPEIEDKAIDNCQSRRSSHWEAREALKKNVEGGDVKFLDKLSTFTQGIAEYLLSGESYEPSFLVEHEIAFLEILDICLEEVTVETSNVDLNLVKK
jgi:hypothetical protein